MTFFIQNQGPMNKKLKTMDMRPIYVEQTKTRLLTSRNQVTNDRQHFKSTEIKFYFLKFCFWQKKANLT